MEENREVLINKKSPKLNKKIKKKSIIYCFISCFIGGEKSPKPS